MTCGDEVFGKDKVKTDYDPEGNSIPAQRVANNKRAAELGITFPPDVEFIDPGRSAKSIEGRDAFKEMIAYLRAHRNIKYVVVYALSRTARNRYDDAILMMTLEKLGVKLISATEQNLDDSPARKAMHGFIAVMNQYRSDLDGEDIKYKMGQKVIAKGGTLGPARIGYLNVRDNSEGREIRTIAMDEKRAPLVLESFKEFATREYTAEILHEVMVGRGLTVRATYKSQSIPFRLLHSPRCCVAVFTLAKCCIRAHGIPAGMSRLCRANCLTACKRYWTRTTAQAFALANTTTP